MAPVPGIWFGAGGRETAVNMMAVGVHVGFFVYQATLWCVCVYVSRACDSCGVCVRACGRSCENDKYMTRVCVCLCVLYVPCVCLTNVIGSICAGDLELLVLGMILQI